MLTLATLNEHLLPVPPLSRAASDSGSTQLPAVSQVLSHFPSETALYLYPAFRVEASPPKAVRHPTQRRIDGHGS